MHIFISCKYIIISSKSILTSYTYMITSYRDKRTREFISDWPDRGAAENGP